MNLCIKNILIIGLVFLMPLPSYASAECLSDAVVSRTNIQKAANNIERIRPGVYVCPRKEITFPVSLNSYFSNFDLQFETENKFSGTLLFKFRVSEDITGALKNILINKNSVEINLEYYDQFHTNARNVPMAKIFGLSPAFYSGDIGEITIVNDNDVPVKITPTFYRR